MPYLDFFSQWYSYAPSLLTGLALSVEVTLVSLLIGIPAGLVLGIVVFREKPISSKIAIVFVEVGRGTPLLVGLQFVYYGSPEIGLPLSSFFSAVTALAWMTATYTSEIFRGAINSIDDGQIEAAVAIGLNQTDMYRFVLAPQSVRVAIPPLIGFSILVFQGTGLAYTISLNELLTRAFFIGSNTFQYLSVLSFAGILYLMVTLPASQLSSYVERRLTKRL